MVSIQFSEFCESPIIALASNIISVASNNIDLPILSLHFSDPVDELNLHAIKDSDFAVWNSNHDVSFKL